MLHHAAARYARRSFRLCLVQAVLIACLATSASALSENFQQTFELSADGRISLENINGNVEIEGWDRDQVEVNYVKKARTEAGLERMEVEIEHNGNRLEISTEYRRRDGDRQWDDGGSVDFVLYVPRQARIHDLELVNGNLDLRQLNGQVAVEVVNGDIDAKGLAGGVEMASVNGKVNVAFDRLARGQRVELESVNGSLVVVLPRDADASIEAETVHGRIDNDFGFDVEKGRWVGSSMRGALGDGSARMELENVNGTIKVLAR